MILLAELASGLLLIGVGPLYREHALGLLFDEIEHFRWHRVPVLLASVFRDDAVVGQAHHHQVRQIASPDIVSLIHRWPRFSSLYKENSHF